MGRNPSREAVVQSRDARTGMEGVSLKSRAIAFAFSIGAVAFILAILAAADPVPDSEALLKAVVVAIICGIMSWASAERALSGTATAVDSAIARVVAAAQGDLTTPMPPEVHEALPELSEALDSMFAQVRANIESVHNLAMYDPVTSLANRTQFKREAERVLRALGDGACSALAFIDLDHFKAVNDNLGHACGDQLLARVANRLRAVSGGDEDGGELETPIVGRLAGDEFTILYPVVDGREDLARRARAILAALNEPFEIAGQKIEIGASIGLAMRPDHGRTLTALMRSADIAMYHAKESGRGQFEFYADALAARMAARSRLETDLRTALERDEFTLVFQPQMLLATGEITVAEALLRWNHPVDGVRLPGTFLSTAEDSGLIVEIGDWAIEEVAATLARWPSFGLAHRMAVNLSPRQIGRVDFFSRLRAAFERQGASLCFIEFELSETLAMECSESTVAELAAMRADGATVAIDDFGAGSSNITRLRAMPVDRIKLDRTLIAQIESDAMAREIVQALIGLINGLGAQTVAEGVETSVQLEMLRVMGCHAIQGYAIAPPMTELEYRHWRGLDMSTVLAAS